MKHPITNKLNLLRTNIWFTICILATTANFTAIIVSTELLNELPDIAYLGLSFAIILLFVNQAFTYLEYSASEFLDLTKIYRQRMKKWNSQK